MNYVLLYKGFLNRIYMLSIILIFFTFFICLLNYNISVFLIDKIAHLIAFIFVNFESKGGKIAKYNISLVFPKYSKDKVDEIFFKSSKITIINGLNKILERLLYFTNYYKSIKYTIPEQMIKDIDEYGVVLVGSHFGNFEDIKYLGKFINREVNLVYKNQNTWLLYILYYMKILNPKNLFHKLNYIKYIKKKTFNKLLKLTKDVTVLGCDRKARNFDKKKIFFLNQLVKFHYGPAVLALKTKKKIWSCALTYNLDTKQQNWEFVNISSQLSSNLSLHKITQKIADELTKKIIESPEQYMWIYNRFNLKI